MKIMGIHMVGSQSSACITVNGNIIVGIAEERLTRQKRSRDFPSKSINYCLNYLNLKSVEELDAIAINWNPQTNMENINSSGFTQWRRYDPEWLYIVPNNLQKFYSELKTDSTKLILEKNKTPIYFINHHLCHIASYFESSFEDAAILVIDEYGEIASTTLAYAKGTKIKKLDEIYFPHSLGSYYAAITEFLGFTPNGDEWKVMGAGALGDSNKYYSKLKQLIRWDDKRGEYTVDQVYFVHANRKRDGYVNDRFEEYIGFKRRFSNDELKQCHYDLAAAAQKVYEDVLIKLLNRLYNLTGSKNIVISGGCAMNSLANGKVLNNSKFENIFIPFAAADNGTSIGAALWTNYCILNQERKIINSVPSPFLGPNFSNNEIETILNKFKIQFEKHNDVTKVTAQYIADGLIVAWFQGRMEMGERALGNRSILADPRQEAMKDKINAVIKYREKFRPFAPSVLNEKAKEYFDIPEGVLVPYMEQVYMVKEDKKKFIPAVTHYDGTARVHTVTKEFNEQYYNIIKEFETLTGVPVVLNTSFNVQGEPIVCTPADALKTFYTSGLDVLVLGNYIIKKQ